MPAIGRIAETPSAQIDTGPNNKRQNEQQTRVKKWLLAGAVILSILAVTAWYIRRLLPPLRVVGDYVQITHNGHIDTLAGSDGSKLYFNQMLPSSPFSIAQIGIASREIVPISVGLPDPIVQDVSRRHRSSCQFCE